MPSTRSYWITAALVLALAGFLLGYLVATASRTSEPTPVTIVTTTTSSTWLHVTARDLEFIHALDASRFGSHAECPICAMERQAVER